MSAPTFNINAFSEFPVLRSKRLTLREIIPADAPALFQMRSNPLSTTFTASEPMVEESAARGMVERLTQGFACQESIAWGCELRDNSNLIGVCGFNTIDAGALRAEIGGELNANYWGKGIPYEALGLVLDFGFRTLGLHTVEARINPANRGAIALVEQLHFEKEGHFKSYGLVNGQFADLAVYTCFNPAH